MSRKEKKMGIKYRPDNILELNMKTGKCKLMDHKKRDISKKNPKTKKTFINEMSKNFKM